MHLYDVILADPPWKYTDRAKGAYNQASDHYNVMDIEAIAALPEWKQLAKPGVLFMWATSPLLEDALTLGAELGLHYRGVQFVWVKTKKDGTPIGAAGIRPSIVKPLTEFVLGFSTERTGRPLKLASESIVQTVFAPKREHSRKPEEVMDRIEQMYPDMRKLEMFSRETRPGWDVFGNEVGKFDT